MEIDRENPSPLTRLRGAADAHWQDWSPELETAYLQQLAGVERLEDATSLQLVVNTAAGGTIDHLGGTLPNLHELNLNGSMLDSLRDLGTGFRLLQVLWVSRCGLKDLDGLNGLPALRELYAAYNDISDLQPVDACQYLEVLDMEGNCITDADMVMYLASCANLQTLALAGNPAAEQPDYRRAVCTALPSLQTLDDEPVTPADRTPQQQDTGMNTATSGSPGLAGPRHGGAAAEAEVPSSPPPLPPSPLKAAAAAAGVLSAAAGRGSAQRNSLDSGAAATTASPTAASARAAAADADEVALVVAGIKHARVGVDSHEFREIEMNLLVATADGTHLQLDSRPGTSTLLPANASTWVRTLRSSREGSLAALRASHAAAMGRSGSQSPASPCSDSPINSRPPSSQQQQRSPAQAQQERWAMPSGVGAALGLSQGLGGSGGTWRPSSGTGNGGVAGGGFLGMMSESPRRPGSGGYRTGTACSAGRPYSARPGTAASFSVRIGTSASTGATPNAAAVGLYWAKNRIGGGGGGGGPGGTDAGGGGGHGGGDSSDAEVAVCSSKLTQGSDTTFGGSFARDLRKWKGAAVRAAASASAGGAADGDDATAVGGGNGLSLTLLRGGQLDPKALLEELKRWKLETADRVLFVDPDEAEPSGEAGWAGAEGTDLVGNGLSGCSMQAGGALGGSHSHRPDVLSLSSSHEGASTELGGMLGPGLGMGLGFMEHGPEPVMSPTVPGSPLQPPRPPAGTAAAVRRKMVLAKVLRDVAADSISSSGTCISEILAGLRPVHSPAGFHKPGIAWGAPSASDDGQERERSSASSTHHHHHSNHHHHHHSPAGAQQQQQSHAQQRCQRPSSARSTCSSSGQSDHGHGHSVPSHASRPGSREEDVSTPVPCSGGSSSYLQYGSSLQRQKSSSRAPGLPPGPSASVGTYKVASVAGEVDVRSSNPNPAVRLGQG